MGDQANHSSLINGGAVLKLISYEIKKNAEVNELDAKLNQRKLEFC